MNAPSTSSFVQVSDAQQQQTRVKVIAGYALQQKLGSGSFAVVYKAVRTPQSSSPEEVVAVKAISRTSEKLTKKVLQNLEIEIAILRNYRHRNIVCLHDVQKTERHFYLILEYCGGGDVQRLIRSRRTGRLTEGLTRRLMRDLAAGLQFLWSQELIHRDIKPQNLLLTGPLPLDEMNDPEKTEELERKRHEVNFPSHQFTLKIADFGFARHLQTTSLAETLCGSPLYMAPEILQHHRYDAKADLWSVGTVLFEMISGAPPFHGENHLDLLKNIQRKAVRLPKNVSVSGECVTLLRLLLNRNPLSRAGFKEFFDACSAFVALGCQGSDQQPQPAASTVSFAPAVKMPVASLSEAPHPMKPVEKPAAALATRPPMNAAPSPVHPPAPALVAPRTPVSALSKPVLTPLVPSPPPSGMKTLATTTRVPSSINVESPMPALHRQHPGGGTTELTLRRPESGPLHQSTSDNSFVMVEHSSVQKSPATVIPVTIETGYRAPSTPQPVQSPNESMLPHPSQILSTKGEYMVVKPPKGMLSTSPGTGGALMGMLTGQTRVLYENSSVNHWESHVSSVTKMLATSEDVGRRAISVAHLGDSRAYIAMKMIMMSETVSSCLLATPMEGIIEEEAADQSGAVTDDSSSVEPLATARRRRSSSVSMPDAKDETELEEMPFAVNTDSQPLLSAGIPSRASTTSVSKSVSITSSRQSVKPTSSLIRSHFSEALSCYLKALKMLKGALHGAQGVERELQNLTTRRLAAEQASQVQALVKRCNVTQKWLSEQFKGILERADASTTEIGKLPSNNPEDCRESRMSQTVEELIYNHALIQGREGAVKQLLGQLEASRECYRSAGLLAETLLMETNLVANDRKILEEYVDGFAARIMELDEHILQQQKVAASSNATSVLSRRSPAVVSMVGNPLSVPKLNLGPSSSTSLA